MFKRIYNRYKLPFLGLLLIIGTIGWSVFTFIYLRGLK